MLVWEMKLKVRRSACEGRLAFYRERHSEIVVERARCPYKGGSWNKKSDKLALLHRMILRELDEIKHVRSMANCGPIVGNRMVLHVRDGLTHKIRPGPSIIDIMQRESDRYDKHWKEEGPQTPVEFEHEPYQYDAKSIARGIDLALEVLYNPYRFLDPDERSAYDAAEQNEGKIIRSASRQQKPDPTLTQAKASGDNIVSRTPRS
jgi:hypothetical protein